MEKRRGRPRVVVVGGGFGGLNAARALRAAPVDVLVIDRENHHLFQPLLYQVAAATLPPSHITAPIRWLLRTQRNATVLCGNVTSIDPKRGTVTLITETLEYDYLVLATGAHHSYFGHDNWSQLAPGLKTLEDALEIRARFLGAFERAEWEPDESARRLLQTFVIVGGGPTGVELAGILPEIARRAMRNDFRVLNPQHTRVILLEGGPRLLPSFSESTSARVALDLAELGVEVRTGAMVTHITDDAVFLGNEAISAKTVFWAAGNSASELGASLGVQLDKQGRVRVLNDLSVPGHPEIFVVGDLAVFMQDGAEIPGVAQVAIQGGRSAGKNIARDLAGATRVAFRYRDRGNAATIGRNKAIVELGGVALTGRAAWFFWLFLHVLYLAGFRNRLAVLLEWAYAYFSYERGARLVTKF